MIVTPVRGRAALAVCWRGGGRRRRLYIYIYNILYTHISYIIYIYRILYIHMSYIRSVGAEAEGGGGGRKKAC
jgi:hypothetical protein